MKHIWNYGGQGYRFDISEAGCAGRLSSALGVLRCEISANESEESTASKLERHCRMIRAFFDAVFGDGCGRQICGDVMSAEAHSAAYVDFILFVNSEVLALSELCAEIEAGCMRRMQETA